LPVLAAWPASPSGTAVAGMAAVVRAFSRKTAAVLIPGA